MKKRILVAPLNWGLGHATRCIPVINALIRFGFEPIVASDGDALAFLKKEFPSIITIELPTYNINYSKNPIFFKLNMLKQAPKLLRAIHAEKIATKTIVESHNIKGIISDNRLGVYNKKVPSVVITHQLNVLSGSTTWISSLLHKTFIENFDVCWVPDYKGAFNLSDKLGHSHSTFKIPIKYIGSLSRFSKKETVTTNKILVLLSGPEPQRSLLYEKLFQLLKNYPQKVVIVKGSVEKKQTIQTMGNLRIYNFMTTQELETTINESELIVSRPGYTTVMDLAKLGKKAFFIPTPGQYEQEYLAKKLSSLNIAPYCNQKDVMLSKLEVANSFKGFEDFVFETDFKDLFSLF